MASAILLTVPHAISEYTAVNAAKCLETVLRKASPHITIHNHIGDEGREICDLNRRQCRDRPFRQRIRNSLTMLQRPALLIDVHSFPPVELVEIFFLSEQNHNPQPWVIDMLRFLLNKNIRATIRRGGENDIIASAIHNFDAYATLIEFNEALSDERMKEICQYIVGWLQQRFFVAIPARCNLM